MEAISELSKINYSSILLGVFVIIAGLKASMSLLEWLSQKVGIEFRWMRKKHEDHELLIKTANKLENLESQRCIDVENSINNDKIIQENLKKLTNMFIDKEIDDMRWEIINFSAKISEGKPCNKDSYKHCLRTYEKYENLLEENGLTNGEVNISMEIINESYKEKMKNGF